MFHSRCATKLEAYQACSRRHAASALKLTPELTKECSRAHSQTDNHTDSH